MGLFGSNKVVSKQKLAPEASALIKPVVPIAQDYLKTPIKQGAPVVQGPTKAQLAARGSVVKAANTTLPGLVKQGVGGTTNLGQAGLFGTGGLGQILGDYLSQAGGRQMITSGKLLDPNANPATKGMISAATRPITQQLNEATLPGIGHDFVGGGSYGSTRQGIAEGIARRGAMDATADATSAIVNNNYNTGLGAMLSGLNAQTGAASSGVGQGLGAGLGGVNALPGLGQLAFMPGLAKDAVATTNANQNQAVRQEASDRYTTQQMMPFMQAQDVANLAAGLGGGSAVTKGGGASGGAEAASLGMGLGQLGLLAYGMGLFS